MANIIAVSNQKGGVGKTTVAANLAAYISEARHLPVLLIDLDYQGSLSNMMMLAAEKSDVESRVETLFDPAASPVQVSEAQVHLAPKLKQVWLSPANYTFAKLENVLLAKWLVEEQQEYGGFLALRPGTILPPDVTNAGFRFGHALLGTADFEVVQFVLTFYGFETYNVLVNPANPLVQTVLTTMVTRGDYLFFALDATHSVTAFRSEIGETNLAGLASNLARIEHSHTTAAQYRRAVSQFARYPDDAEQ